MPTAAVVDSVQSDEKAVNREPDAVTPLSKRLRMLRIRRQRK